MATNMEGLFSFGGGLTGTKVLRAVFRILSCRALCGPQTHSGWSNICIKTINVTVTIALCSAQMLFYVVLEDENICLIMGKIYTPPTPL